MNVLVRAAAVVLALAALAGPAQAAFPGANGAIGFAFRNASGDSGPFVEDVGLATKLLGRRQARDLVRCRSRDGEPIGPDCTARQFRDPSYSPDGRNLVFDAGNHLALAGRDSSGVAPLPATTADDGDPAFSPDGRRIAFTGTNDRGTTDIYVHRLGGLFVRLIVRDAAEPAWSSRNEIAYVRSGNVYVTNRNGSNRRFVASGVSPDWSPHGRRLVFVRPLPNLVPEGSVGRMFTIGAAGRGLRRVFPRVTNAFGPVWSPDGRWIAFERFDSGIFAKRLGTRGPARQVAVTQVSGESGSVTAFDPTWGRRPRTAP